MKRMGKIIGLGNALVDVLAPISDDSLLSSLGLQKGMMQLVDGARAEEIAETLQHLHPQRATGGSAGNAMLALAGLGDKPGFIGRVGRDEMGRFYARSASEAGIEMHLVEADGPSGVAYTLVSPDGERTFGTSLGVAAGMTASDLLPEMLRGYSLLHVEGYLVQNHDLIETALGMARRERLRVSIDLASANVVRADLDFFRHLVEHYVDVVFANEEESLAFTGEATPEAALSSLARQCDIAVVKLGAQGAMARCGDEQTRVAARRVPVVDTTAAGDFFAGGFFFGLAHRATLAQCLQCGAAASEQVIQIVGTRLSQSAWLGLRKQINEILSR